MAESIQNLRVYELARTLEEQVFEQIKQQSGDLYPLGNQLRRASSAVAHYINEAHERFSYRQKIELLHLARQSAESMEKLLDQAGLKTPAKEEYINVVKQLWGLIKWLNQRQAQKQAEQQARAGDELVAARA